jgi:hypothetical protein
LCAKIEILTLVGYRLRWWSPWIWCYAMVAEEWPYICLLATWICICTPCAMIHYMAHITLYIRYGYKDFLTIIYLDTCCFLSSTLKMKAIGTSQILVPIQWSAMNLMIITLNNDYIHNMCTVLRNHTSHSYSFLPWCSKRKHHLYNHIWYYRCSRWPSYDLLSFSGVGFICLGSLEYVKMYNTCSIITDLSNIILLIINGTSVCWTQNM